jgi:hypothetical protein
VASGPEVDRLRAAGATVSDGPEVDGQRWLIVKSEGATAFIAKADLGGLIYHAERLERVAGEPES